MKRSRNSGVTSKRSGKLSLDDMIATSISPDSSSCRERARHALDQLQLDALVAPVEVGEQAGEPARADRAHDADLEMRVFQAKEARRFLAHAGQLVDDLLEPGPQQRAKIGDVREVALAAEQQAAHLVLELLDGAAQRRLGHIALLRGPREVAGVADGQEIADVMNVHGPRASRARHGFDQCSGRIDFDSSAAFHC